MSSLRRSSPRLAMVPRPLLPLNGLGAYRAVLPRFAVRPCLAVLASSALLACVPRSDLDGYSRGGPGGGGNTAQPPPNGEAGSSNGTPPSPPDASGGGAPPTDAAPPPSNADTGPPPDGGATGALPSARVLSTVPEDGAAGVPRDPTLTITFDTPMDRATVEAAFSFEGLAQLSPEFRWSGDSTVLEVVLDAPLSYATGSDPEQVTPLRYGYRISSAARDVNGNPLREVQVSFTTLREIQVQLGAQSDSALTGNWRSDGVYGTDVCAPEGTSMCIGDSSFGPNASYRGFASFDLAALPAQAQDLQSAELELPLSAVLGAPFTGLGALVLERASYTEIGPAAFSASGEQLGSRAFATIGTTLSFDVLSTVRSDWLAAQPSRYRLRFTTASDLDGVTDLAFVSRSSVGLRISYLLP